MNIARILNTYTYRGNTNAVFHTVNVKYSVVMMIVVFVVFL